MLGPVRRVTPLVLCACAALGAQQHPDLEATLAQFPDNDLPTLLGLLADKAPTAAEGLRKLGPAAHEALLGAVLDPYFPRAGLLQAFGEFDAHCGWALPLLGDPEVSLTNEVQDLLLRLGPAAAPLVPELNARAADPKSTYLRPFAEKLAAATDGPVPDSAPRKRSTVARELVPALLGCLGKGPDARRWPALQALLCLDDDVATSATEALLELSLQPESQRRAEDLLLSLRCIYSTRCLQGMMPLRTLPADDLPAEARRRALAGRVLDTSAIQVWQASADAELRRTAVLAQLQVRSRQRGFPMPLPDAPDADVTVQHTIELVRGLRRRDGAVAASAALPELRSQDQGRILSALQTLAGQDLRDAPDELWSILVDLATQPEVQGGSLQEHLLRNTQSTRRAASTVLHSALRGGSPASLVDLMPRLTALPNSEQYLREALEHIDLTVLEAHLRAASEDPAQLASWLAMLRKAGQPMQRREGLDALVTALAPCLPDLPAAAQVDWLELDRKTPVPEAVWRALFSTPDVAVRRRAAEIAWRSFHQRPFSLDLALPLLGDQDPEVARNGVFLLAHTKSDRERAVTALAAAFPDANAELKQWIVYGLWAQREFATPARKTIDAAFASEHPRVRVHAAMLRLHFDRDDAAAFAALQQLLTHEDRAVRQHAFMHAANDQAVALRCIDLAITALDDSDQEVGYAAARLLGNLPQAKDRALPALRALVERAPHNSLVAQRARSAITRLEQADSPPADKR
ncbi:MAG: hypothetical protein H6838_13935 [Planctomycetes bacterium]|nr:hypothetical protein [Planctomycetota bacterium]MCB9886590.1 hypothetical protein [Planctomycetota bacterium]